MNMLLRLCGELTCYSAYKVSIPGKSQISGLWSKISSSVANAISWLPICDCRLIAEGVLVAEKAIAPNNETTWELLKAKHPSGPALLVQAVDCAPITLEPDFNIHSVLLSFPKGTAASPSGWDRDRPAAMDIIVTSPLTPVILGESCQVVGAVAENRKMQTNSPKCQELGWACAPLAVESYGNWGEEHSLGLHPTLPSASPALVVADIYGRLNLHLVKSVARALLAR
eukprot:Em0005g1205a